MRLNDLARCSGRGVRVAVVDSGVHAAHPHVGGISGGVAIDAAGDQGDDVIDRLGHGTAVAAAIREKAPEAELLAVKVFDRTLAATGHALVEAIEWSAAHEARLINLSLGTVNRDHAGPLQAAVHHAADRGAIVVAAAPQAGSAWLPGGLAGVIAVDVDWACPRDECRVSIAADGDVRLSASGYPRPIPGVPPERNLSGPSFAVANATGFLALAIEGEVTIRTIEALAVRLRGLGTAFLLAAALLLCQLTPAWAQDAPTRVELGGHVEVAGVTLESRAPAVGGWIDVNLSRSLALEFRIARIAERSIGPSVQVTGGVRAMFVRTPRVEFFGTAMPGFDRVGRGAAFFFRPGPHYVLDLGIGLSVAATRRWVARVELDRDLHAPRSTSIEEVDVRTGSVIVVSDPAYIRSRWNLVAGASYRLGSAVRSMPADLSAGRWSAGPQLGYTVSTSALNATGGGFASYRLASWCDVDASISGFLSGTVPPSPYEGGRVTQAVAGLKLGVRDRRIGVFFKARGGVNSYSKTIKFALVPQLGRSTVAVMDLGGVVEVSVSRRVLMRVDIGESLAFSPSRLVAPLPGFEIYQPPGGERFPGQQVYSLPVRWGIGWRF